MNPIFLALDSLFTRYINLAKDETGNLPTVHFDPPWPSSCLVEATENQQQGGDYWQPKERKAYELFDELENAFEFSFPDELKWYYGSFWSNGICVDHPELAFNLIQLWNEEDEEQLKENMLGHVFAKTKNKLPISFFIGCTDGNDVICIELESRAIVLEKPGYKAYKVLAPDLESFLLQLAPNLDRYD